MKGILNDPNNAQELLDMTAGILFLLDKDGVCVDIMSPKSPVWFLQEDILKGQNLFKLLPTSTFKELYPNFRDVLEKSIVSSQNYEMMLMGQTYYFNCTMQNYRGMVLCQYRDTTNRSLEQKQLAKRNKEMTEIQQIAMIGSWVYNSQINVLRYTGHGGVMEHDGVIDINLSTYSSYVLPDDEKSFNEWIQKNKRGEIGETVNFRIRYNDKIFYMKARTLNFEQLPDGNYIAEGYAHNVTDIQQSRNDINLLTHAVNNAVEYIFACDLEGNLIFGNKMFRKSMNMTTEEDITQHKVWEVYTMVENKKMWENAVKLIKDGGMQQGFIMLNPLPLYPEVLAIEANSFWVTDDSGKETIWMFGRNVTDTVEAAKKLKEAKERAEKSERMKSAFLANMSHDIRTPLNAIVGFSRLLPEVENPEDRAEFSRIIEENNERLLHLINELLDLSKIEANMVKYNLTNINMHDFCTEVYNTFYLQCPAEIKLVNEGIDNDIFTYADKNRAMQVISNLIENALKFTKNGSISFGYRERENFIETYVTDTGIGIAPEKLDCVFDRFTKLNDNAKGTGLGLSICKMLVEQMGGKLQVESKLGKGTTFTFSLPKAKAE